MDKQDRVNSLASADGSNEQRPIRQSPLLHQGLAMPAAKPVKKLADVIMRAVKQAHSDHYILVVERLKFYKYRELRASALYHQINDMGSSAIAERFKIRNPSDAQPHMMYTKELYDQKAPVGSIIAESDSEGVVIIEGTPRGREIAKLCWLEAYPICVRRTEYTDKDGDLKVQISKNKDLKFELHEASLPLPLNNELQLTEPVNYDLIMPSAADMTPPDQPKGKKSA